MILTLVLVQRLAAQEQVFYMHQFRPPQMGNKGNFSLFRDSRGFLWSGSIDGLHRFDGSRWVDYRPSKVRGVFRGTNIFSNIVESSQGDLWFSSSEALVCYRRSDEIFSSFSLPNDNSTHSLIGINGDGNLWVRTDKALCRFDPQKKDWTFISALNSQNMVAAVKGKTGSIVGFFSYVYSVKDTLRYHDVLGHTIAFVDKLLTVYDICTANDSTTWIAAEEGLFRADPRKPHALQRIGVGVKGLRGVTCSPNGTIWCTAASNGLMCLESEQLVPVVYRCDPNKKAFAGMPFRVYIDRSGTLWLSYDGEGIGWMETNAPKVTHLTVSPKAGNSDFHIEPIIGTSSGDVLIGTENAGLMQWFSRTGECKPIQLGITPPKIVFHFYKPHAKEGTLVSVPRQVYWLDQSGRCRLLKCLSMDGGTLQSSIYYFFETPNGVLYGCSKQRLYRLTLDEMHDLLQCELVWTSEHKDANLYVGHADNHHVYLNEGDTHLVMLTSSNFEVVARLPHKRISTMTHHLGQDGLIWIGSTEQGLCSWNVYQPEQGPTPFLNHYGGEWAIRSMLCDRRGKLWLGTGTGLWCVDPDNRSMARFTQSDGLSEDALQWKAISQMPDGGIVAGSRNALNFLDTTVVERSFHRPPIQLTGLKLLDTKIWQEGNIGEARRLSLKYNDNTLSFDFVALDFSDPAEVRLRYRLDGYDEPGKWVDAGAGNTGFARYAQLAPGHYQLQIMAANSDGVWDPTPKTLDISIAPPFWQTWWFGALMAAVLAGLLYALFQARLRRERQKQQLALERAEQARRAAQLEADNAKLATAVAEQERANTEIRLQTLRLQMNPHFIFNSLNSINSFILRRQPEQASNYLDDFAQLMRWTLDRSDREMVSLQEELDMLGRFVGLEARRLPFPLRWECSVAETLDSWDIEVPALLLQPFLENAIWHGLLPKQGEGFLRLTIEQKGDLLVCCITDNGVGRAAASRSRPTGHVSKAESITRKRLEAHDRRCGQAGISSLSIEDLFHANGVPAGTKVILALQICRD